MELRVSGRIHDYLSAVHVAAPPSWTLNSHAKCGILRVGPGREAPRRGRPGLGCHPSPPALKFAQLIRCLQGSSYHCGLSCLYPQPLTSLTSGELINASESRSNMRSDKLLSPYREQHQDFEDGTFLGSLGLMPAVSQLPVLVPDPPDFCSPPDTGGFWAVVMSPVHAGLWGLSPKWSPAGNPGGQGWATSCQQAGQRGTHSYSLSTPQEE